MMHGSVRVRVHVHAQLYTLCVHTFRADFMKKILDCALIGKKKQAKLAAQYKV